MYSADGKRNFVGAEDMRDAVHSTDAQRSFFSNGKFLQVFLRPSRGDDCIYICDVRRKGGSSGGENLSFSVTKKSFNPTEVDSISSSKGTNDQMEDAVTSLIGFLAEHRGLFTERLLAEFIVDDNEHVWLSNISELLVRSTDLHAPAVLPLVRGWSSEGRRVSSAEGPYTNFNDNKNDHKNDARNEFKFEGSNDYRNGSGGLSPLGMKSSAIDLVPANDSQDASVALRRPKSDNNIMRR
jgi:hypothetical protein